MTTVVSLDIPDDFSPGNHLGKIPEDVIRISLGIQRGSRFAPRVPVAPAKKELEKHQQSDNGNSAE